MDIWINQPDEKAVISGDTQDFHDGQNFNPLPFYLSPNQHTINLGNLTSDQCKEVLDDIIRTVMQKNPDAIIEKLPNGKIKIEFGECIFTFCLWQCSDKRVLLEPTRIRGDAYKFVEIMNKVFKSVKYLIEVLHAEQLVIKYNMCTCCEKHMRDRPTILGPLVYVEPKINMSKVTCDCQCRQNSRMVCRSLCGVITHFKETKGGVGWTLKFIYS